MSNGPTYDRVEALRQFTAHAWQSAFSMDKVIESFSRDYTSWLYPLDKDEMQALLVSLRMVNLGVRNVAMSLESILGIEEAVQDRSQQRTDDEPDDTAGK